MPADLSGLEQAATRNRETQIRFIMSVGSRRWKTIIGFMAICTLGGGIIGHLRHPPHVTYVATTDLMVAETPADKAILQVVGTAPVAPTTPRALIELVGKRQVAEEVARALVQQDIAYGRSGAVASQEDEYESRADKVMSALDIRNDPANRGIIHIVARSADRTFSTDVAEFGARVFVNRARQMQVDQQEQTYDIIKRQKDELQKSLETAEQAKNEYRKNLEFDSFSEVQQYLRNHSDNLRNAEYAKQATAEKLANIAKQLKLKNQELPQSLGQINDEVITQMRTDLDGLLQKQLESDYQPTSVYMQELQADIQDKTAAIVEAVARLQKNVAGGGDVLDDIRNLRKQYTEAELDDSKLDITIATEKRLLQEMNQKQPELANKYYRYEQLEQEAERVRAQFARVVEKEFDLRTSMGKGGGEILRYNKVSVNTEKPPFQSWVNFVIGGCVGFLLGIAWAFIAENLDTSIRSLEDVTDYIGIEVIGTIPRMRFGKGRVARRRGAYVPDVDEEQVDACIVTQHDPKSPISEAYRTLRTNFQFATIQQKPKTVMVTSAVPGEGKTTTAVNLAVTMADRGIRVLLIDTDLRRPNVHRVLKIERGPGLSDVLRESLDVHTVIRKTRIENLSIISSGRVPPNPSELIASERMQHLVALLGREFDLVVCDAPSILVVTDPVLLATHMDTVILVVSVNNARRETIQRAKKLLDTAQASIAGVVLNGLEATRRHYYYYYYYYDDTEGYRTRRWYHL